MAIVRLDPVRGFENLTRKMNSMLGEFEKGINVEYGGFAPKIDISEDENKLYLTAEIPGISKENIKLSINQENVLMIKGEKKREEKTENEAGEKKFVRTERSYGEFMRSFTLPDNIKQESINARFENGILYVSLDKTEEVKPKEIDIKID